MSYGGILIRLDWFYGMSTIIGYLMTNPVYSYIYIYISKSKEI